MVEAMVNRTAVLALHGAQDLLVDAVGQCLVRR
eukprot:CAMPEP_0115540350 /NCGR_PEP_ID=MMETSP0271-20121206/89881_1 /TAXON_ID=71861 /ORGANISM="Scrippsiella trochoidea, Strain CCMP3099" /LENGTH=32 /DNA_ID= /DNA_START= /DNA_END= /DNA_ORIENTATION=